MAALKWSCLLLAMLLDLIWSNYFVRDCFHGQVFTALFGAVTVIHTLI